MDKRLFIQLNGARKVTGVLRGYDPFMNIVLDETVEEVSPTEKHNIGMVVRFFFFLFVFHLLRRSCSLVVGYFVRLSNEFCGRERGFDPIIRSLLFAT